jgi:aminoglycoside 6'-N-acetyltransferase I
MIEIRLLRAGEEAILSRAPPDVFDNPVRAELAREFLNDPRHHIVVALDGDAMVGFASAVHYVHPDKPTELWINEVDVAATYRGRGIAKQILDKLLAHGRTLGCGVAWVLTDIGNGAARALYASVGGTELSRDTVHVEFDLTK